LKPERSGHNRRILRGDPQRFAAASLKRFRIRSPSTARACDPQRFAAASLKREQEDQLDKSLECDPQRFAAASLKLFWRWYDASVFLCDPQRFAAASLKHDAGYKLRRAQLVIRSVLLRPH